MTGIQVLFLFTSAKNLSPEEQTRITEIVCEEYCRQFDCKPEDVSAVLMDGVCKGGSNKNDIVLAIQPDNRVMNEGRKREELKKAVANRLSCLLFMKHLGFNGMVGTQDGRVKAEKPSNASGGGEGSMGTMDYRSRAKMYQAEEPKYSFEMLKIPQSTLNQIEQALGRIEYEQDVFENWGLYAIMPSPVSALSFYGPPGTGKSMAAEAIASKLGRKIIRASYADIENKYVGEGPKNVGAIFLAAEEQNAVLFIDEADSLLSKRLVNVSDPSGQAMNSMRSQLLICLERFHGIVIFATNLAVNYDRAFVSRLINVKFEMPDAPMRQEIWAAHLYPGQTGKVKLNIPLAWDVDLKALAEDYVLCGRDIRNAVVNACVEARRRNLAEVDQECLRQAAEAGQKSYQEMQSAQDHTNMKKEVDVPQQVKEVLADSLTKSIQEKQETENTK